MLELDPARFSVAGIAERVSKGPGCITQRLRLTEFRDLRQPAEFMAEVMGSSRSCNTFNPSIEHKRFCARAAELGFRFDT
jgi:hypothetical protein